MESTHAVHRTYREAYDDVVKNAEQAHSRSIRTDVRRRLARKFGKPPPPPFNPSNPVVVSQAKRKANWTAREAARHRLVARAHQVKAEIDDEVKLLTAMHPRLNNLYGNMRTRQFRRMLKQTSSRWPLWVEFQERYQRVFPADTIHWIFD